jgi:hypothetical protein
MYCYLYHFTITYDEKWVGCALKIVNVCTGFGENSDEIIRFYLEDFMEE